MANSTTVYNVPLTGGNYYSGSADSIPSNTVAPTIYLAQSGVNKEGAVRSPMGPTQIYSGSTPLKTYIDSGILSSGQSAINLSSAGGSTGAGASASTGGSMLNNNYGLPQGALASAMSSLPQNLTPEQFKAATGRNPDQVGQGNKNDQFNSSGLTDLVKSLYGQVTPVDSASIVAQQEAAAGIQQKQQAVNDYTAQLNAINAKAQAAQLSVTGQGRGIPEAIIGGQQAQIAKEAAIQALPVAAQLSAAQGNLQMAQQHVDTYSKLLISDAQNRYDQQIAVIQAVIPFATASEQRRLSLLDQQAKQTFEQSTVLAKAKADAISSSLHAPSSVISAITNATRLEDVAALASPYNVDNQYKSAQVANINSQIQERNSAPGGVVTLNGKPQNVSQASANGYADRLNMSNIVIDSLGDKFTGIASYAGQYLPNALQSGDRQAFEQAKRNFVTAVLRRESGAAISQSEFDTEALKYFPQPGDKPETLVQKANARNTAINSLYREANVARPVFPGQIIESEGVKYRVSSDGVTLEPL